MERIDLTGQGPNELQGVLLRPDKPTGLGILILTGSSGRVDVERASLFAARGAVALAQRWWGGPGQSPGICMIPLETFTPAIDRLVAEGCTRIAMLGSSKGAEATLLTAVADARVDVAIAFAPTHVTWVASGPGFDGFSFYARSSFTLGGVEVPFIALDTRWRPPAGSGPVHFRTWFEKSLKTFAEDVAAASITVERARADFVLVGGEADALWPSADFAKALAARLEQAGRTARLVLHAGAGHRTILPGEPILPEPTERAWGGSETADQELGQKAWQAIAEALQLDR